MNNYLFIVNPVSGKGKGEHLLPFINSYLKSHNIDYKILITEYHLHALKLVKENADNFDNIIVIGGDGTLNEVINALSEVNLSKNVGIISVGSGNDFIKNGDFGQNSQESLKIMTAPTPKIISVDVCFSTIIDENDEKIDRYFVNSLGIGLDAQVAYYKEQNQLIKGILSYLIAVLKALSKFNPIEIDLSYNDAQIKGKKLLCCIGNGVSSGGGFYLTPEAKIDDGYLNLCLVDNIKLPLILKYLPLAFLNKIGNAKVVKFDIFKTLNLTLSKGTFVHLDGEIISTKAKSVSVEVLKKKLKFICK